MFGSLGSLHMGHKLFIARPLRPFRFQTLSSHQTAFRISHRTPNLAYRCVHTTRGRLVLVLQSLGVIVAGACRQLYRHCSEPLETTPPVDSAAWARTPETVHIYRARARVVWTNLKKLQLPEIHLMVFKLFGTFD
jgi:hypothetical protein